MIFFTRDKSKNIRYWNCEVEQVGTSIFIVKRFGILHGKETVTRTEIKSGKNIGKKNETTPLEQANLEMKSLQKKQLDSGYVRTIEELNDRVLLLPMLANKWETASHYISEPFVVQPKLDGVRMLIGKQKGKLVVLSRTGKVVNHMDHITNELQWLPEGLFLDGESYNHSITFEEITGMCRTTLESSANKKNLELIEFHVFDVFDMNQLTIKFKKRLHILKEIFNKKFTSIKLVPTRVVKTKDMIPEIHSEYIQQGYEGIMIRDLESVYTLGERSNYLLKYKTFQTDEYKIVGAEEAKGRDSGTVVWICQTPNGQRFGVRPQGTYDQRQAWLSEKSSHIGKMLTVKYQNLTVEGIPRFPVGLTFRDYE